MDKELEQFQADLLQSVKEMKAGKAARLPGYLKHNLVTIADSGRGLRVCTKKPWS